MYTQSLGPAVVPVGTGAIGVETLSAATAVHGEYLICKPCRLVRGGFYVTTAISATTAPAVAFKKRIINGSDTGGSTVGTVTIPDTTAQGKVVMKDFTPVSFQPGDVLSLEHTVQASSAGAGYYLFEFDDKPEANGNITDRVASA